MHASTRHSKGGTNTMTTEQQETYNRIEEGAIDQLQELLDNQVLALAKAIGGTSNPSGALQYDVERIYLKTVAEHLRDMTRGW